MYSAHKRSVTVVGLIDECQKQHGRPARALLRACPPLALPLYCVYIALHHLHSLILEMRCGRCKSI